ncbi:MAG: pantoate--beta-alanine ligase [Bacillus sp. (in: firmicutes)]
MDIITHAKELQQTISGHRKSGKQIGFVPTMGYLHEGHLQLMKQARKENDVVVLSIFVNPLQFGEGEDYDKYPRDMDHDTKLAKDAGVDYIFFPTVTEMYKDGISVKVKVEKRTNVLCGESRPGHFDGVATVLTKLFNIVQPDKAYFGLKDAQQVAVVEGLVDDFNFPLEVVRVPIIREQDGLAKSSRNVYLLKEEREEAKELYAGLQMAKSSILEGERDPERITAAIRDHIQSQTSAAIDYVEVYSYPELQRIPVIKGEIIIAVAAKFKAARLIDNIILSI